MLNGFISELSYETVEELWKNCGRTVDKTVDEITHEVRNNDTVSKCVKRVHFQLFILVSEHNYTTESIFCAIF